MYSQSSKGKLSQGKNKKNKWREKEKIIKHTSQLPN